MKMNFRDMGPFQNASDTHVNIGFDLSDPPGIDPTYRHIIQGEFSNVTIYFSLHAVEIIATYLNSVTYLYILGNHIIFTVCLPLIL